jgi:hypothetical protein
VDHPGNYYVWLSDVWDDHVEASPLNKRGWVLQERLLSPKVLHFSDQIFWEYKTENFCEIMPTANLDISRHREYNRNPDLGNGLGIAGWIPSKLPLDTIH